MKVPYQKGLLHSTIDYEKLIRLQSESCTKEEINKQNSKTMVKQKAYVKSRIHRGGNK